jgi:mannose-6-phosphate isomerase-like protein (cupin superfamily)
MRPNVLALPPVCLKLPPRQEIRGVDVLAGVLGMAESVIAELHRVRQSRGLAGLAAVGRLRGTGRGIHFRDLIERLEAEHPIELKSPFEASDLVAGAVWEGSSNLGPTHTGALAKLRWSAGADDLPMHVHEFSDRFIIVHEGRGFFHVSDQSVEDFDGSDVRSIPARERDVFIFSRGVVHTFSTLDHPLTLLSCQLPSIAFDDPKQYRLPTYIWIAREHPEPSPPSVGCDPAWSILAAAKPTTDVQIIESVLRRVPLM